MTSLLQTVICCMLFTGTMSFVCSPLRRHSSSRCAPYQQQHLISPDGVFETQLNGRGFSGGERVRNKQRRLLDNDIEGDGFKLSFIEKVRRKIISVLHLKEPGSLILVRHGQTTLNYNKTFTGWIDTDISETGTSEMLYAARLLMERGYDIDITYTSRLKRAIRSSWIMYQEMESVHRPVYKSWRLNERMYGKLEGMSKPGSGAQFGEELIQSYRTGLTARPPAMTPDHPNWHLNERKYADLSVMDIPVTESLQDTMDRTLPLFQDRILPDLMNGRTVMIMAHANSIRGIVKYLDGLTGDEIRQVSIPNGIPLVYKFDRDLKPLKLENSVAPLRGEFLEQKGLLNEAIAREKELVKRIPGYETLETKTGVASESVDARLRGLSLLNEQRSRFSVDMDALKLQSTAALQQIVDNTSEFTENCTQSSTSSNSAEEMMPYKPPVTTPPNSMDSLEGGSVGNSLAVKSKEDVIDALDNELDESPIDEDVDCLLRDKDNNCVVDMTPLVDKESDRVEVGYDALSRTSQTLEDNFVVIIRHGKTEYNKLGIFTGWEDAPLAEEGRAEARAAGKLLKRHGIEFDIVYTSWLSRAIETAWLVMDELDSLWLPIVKTWRLNERMYGALTGLSKKMIRQKHGDKQFKKWRRGYAQRPPLVSSFSSKYPGNDDRYRRYAIDIRPSFLESLIRTLSHRKPEMHRKFPKTESLQDCMQRTIPYFTGTIVPKSIAKGKTVLIASSENAIRGLLMHLCNIPHDRISEVEIPTGLPLVYCFKNKNIRLLEDGTENPSNPLGKYNFGTSPELLFNPCPEEQDEVGPDYLGVGSDPMDPSFDPNGGSECMFSSDGRTYAYDPLLRLNQVSVRVRPDTMEKEEDPDTSKPEKVGLLNS